MARMITARELSDESDALLDEIQAKFALLPRMDYVTLRADIDEFFGDDDRIRDEDYE